MDVNVNNVKRFKVNSELLSAANAEFETNILSGLQFENHNESVPQEKKRIVDQVTDENIQQLFASKITFNQYG